MRRLPDINPQSDDASVIREYRLSVTRAKANGVTLQRGMDSFLRFLKAEGIAVPSLIRPQVGIVEVSNRHVKTYGDVSARYHAMLQLEAQLENDSIRKVVMMHGAYRSGKSTTALDYTGPGTVVFDAPNLSHVHRAGVLRLARGYRAECVCVSVATRLADCMRRNNMCDPMDRVPELQLLRSFERAKQVGPKEGFDSVEVVGSWH